MPYRVARHIVWVLVLWLIPRPVAAQAGTIGGTVVDPGGGAIVGAMVSLARKSVTVASTMTDGRGRFSFPSLVQDAYQLTVTASGFATHTVTVQISSESRELSIVLSVAALVESVNVSAETRGYVAESSTTGTKLDLPRLELPQSVSVVTRQVIDDRVLVRLTETAANVAGVRALTGYTGTMANGYTIRGFSPSLSYSNLRNGFAEYAFLSQRDPVNVERIEFLKGPSSLLYGATDVGGIVNTITKRPLAESRYGVGLTFGGFGYVRPTFDLTGPLNASRTVLYRLTMAYDRGDSYRDLVNNENFFVAPVIVWKPTPRTTVDLEVEAGRFENDFDRGFVIAQEFLDEPVHKNYAEPWTDARNRQVNVMTSLTHQLNPAWSVRVGFSHIRSDTDTNAAGFSFVALRPDRRTINRDNFVTDEHSENFNSQNELYGRFSTGGVTHRLIAGAEVAYYQFKYTFDFRTLAPIDRISPVHGALPGVATFGFGDDTASRTVGVYVQDQIGLTDRLKILIGARGSFLNSRNLDAETGEERNRQTDKAFTPRAGAVFEFTPRSSAFVSLADSFQPNFLSRSRLGEAFDPTRGRQYEVGVKHAWLQNRLFATAAYFWLTKEDVLVPDPEDFTFSFSIQIGEQKSRGLELELTGLVTPRWNVILTYAVIDAFVSADSRAAFLDDKLPGVPRHSGGIYSTYAFESGRLSGVSVGGGVYAAGPRFATLPNPTWELPGYARIDLNAGYRRDRWRFDVAVKNVTNKRYFDIGGFGSMMPQPPRHAVASVNYVF
jgi:iron complex outermembrane receptor protein